MGRLRCPITVVTNYIIGDEDGKLQDQQEKRLGERTAPLFDILFASCRSPTTSTWLCIVPSCLGPLILFTYRDGHCCSSILCVWPILLVYGILFHIQSVVRCHFLGHSRHGHAIDARFVHLHLGLTLICCLFLGDFLSFLGPLSHGTHAPCTALASSLPSIFYFVLALRFPNHQ